MIKYLCDKCHIEMTERESNTLSISSDYHCHSFEICDDCEVEILGWIEERAVE